jgi:hypothetical protein
VQSFQPLHAAAMQGLVVIDAMNREQAIDPVNVLDSFGDQPATLTMHPTVVLFGDARHAHNAPNLRLTTQIRHQRSEQSLDINSVRLGPARPTTNPYFLSPSNSLMPSTRLTHAGPTVQSAVLPGGEDQDERAA